jgi:hypothetical protein
VHRFLDEEAGARRTQLPLAVEDRVDRPSGGRVEVRVGEHDVRRLSPELHRNPLHRAGRGPEDLLAGLGFTGEGDLVDPGVLGHRRADRRAGPRHDVERARREPGLAQEVGEKKSGQGSQ